jgi:hypothetical protein
MSIKSTFFIILSAVLGFLFVRLWNTDRSLRKELTPAPVSLEGSLTKNTGGRPPLEKAIKPSFRPSTTRPASHEKYARKPDGNVIEFRVVNGLAIAYGDVLLGSVEEGNQAERGAYDAPKPQRWDKPEIPYLIHPDLPNPHRVEKALEYFKTHTPVRFVPYDNQQDALVFTTGPEHCYSYLGRVGGLQPIKLAGDCQEQEIIHEVMHALGFIHQQSRADRDRYVEILWPNIEEKFHSQFAIVPEVFLETEGDTPFDYRSAMIYQENSFTKGPGVVSLRSVGTEQIAPTEKGLSEGDLKRLNRLYNLYE